LKNNLINQLENENPDLIIVSGDLTTMVMFMNIKMLVHL